MRYAIISDIHSNLEALEGVLTEIRRRQVDSYICLGDIVGYGANPRECLRLVRSLNALTVMGNHDAAACDQTDLGYFNDYARSAALWTRAQLTAGERSYLAALPLIGEGDGFTIVHSSLDSPREWNYIFSTYDARPAFALLRKQACFIGHSHIPVTFRNTEKEIDARGEYYFRLEEGVRYIINVGSVGQPRDGDPRASFALVDAEKKTVEIVRVDYDVYPAMEKILAAGLPGFLAFRLSVGQ